MEKQGNILVVGGAVGTFLATKLHAAGQEVQLFGRGKVNALPPKLRIQEREYITPPRLAELPQNPNYEQVVIATKLHQLRAVLELMQAVRLQAGTVLSVQNGLVDNAQFSALLGGQAPHVVSVFDGFRIEGAQLYTTDTGRGWKVEDTEEGRAFTSVLTEAGIRCSIEPRLEQVRAEKSIANCCLNGLSAILNKTFAELFADPSIVARINRLFDECYAVLSTEYKLDPKEELRARLFDDWQYADHYSSTWQDHISGKPTEIDFLNGYIIELAKAKRMSVPENEAVVAALKTPNY